MDRTAVIDKVKQYADLVVSAYPTSKVVLFGSYAKENQTEDSDIDVAVVLDSLTDDFLNISMNLCKLTRNIDYRIEPVLVDVMNDKSGFVSDILEYGIVVYDRDVS